MNSFNDSRGFHGLERASSSGLSHLPSLESSWNHSAAILPCTQIRRTQLVRWGYVFEDQFVPKFKQVHGVASVIFSEGDTEICQEVSNVESSFSRKESENVWLNNRGITSRNHFGSSHVHPILLRLVLFRYGLFGARFWCVLLFLMFLIALC